jgi:hypothetical protein
MITSKTDLTQVSEFIDGVFERLKDLRPVWRAFEGADDQPSNFQRPERIDTNYQRHSRMIVYLRRRMELRSTRPFHALPTDALNKKIAQKATEYLFALGDTDE